MPSLLSRYATPFTTGFFLVSLVSGIALFFHWNSSLFHSMHEWLSMVLILPFVLHVWKNWRPFLAYFKRMPMVAALVLSVVAALPFMIPSSGPARGGNPMVAIANKVQSASLETVAPLYGLSPEAFQAELETRGWKAPDLTRSLRAVAADNGKSTGEIYGLLSDLGRR
ncbi:DUF4405 domain-containing protein [Roseibium aestuarii]|uniref:DUF4405 domain-containing protein n=1 Tax=Roseibium aestuarii TaxID=2600299 RepID=A0ABW4JVY3_9HYPH|nr:DUF4405 domain-containing protein [Roseibium aestuarii]